MRGNIVLAAAVFAIGLVVASGVLVLGGRWVADRETARLAAAITTHAQSTERAGQQAGLPIRGALEDLVPALDRHGKSVEQAGDKVSRPQLQGPVTVAQPLTIRGPVNDGSVSINARIAK